MRKALLVFVAIVFASAQIPLPGPALSGSGSGGGGAVTWKNSGSTVVTGSTANLIPLAGQLITTANNPAGTFEAQLGPDPAIMLTRATDQAGTDTYCGSTTGNTTYTCTLSPTLTAYTRGMRLLLDVDTANVTTATLAVDGLAAKSVLSRSGGALSAADVPANKPVWVAYDGTQFILQSGGGSSLTAGNQMDITSNVVSANPHDFTKVAIKDNFCINGTFLSAGRDGVGNLGWYMDGTGAAAVTLTFPGPGGLASGLCRVRANLVGTSSGDALRLLTHNNSPIFIPSTSTNLKSTFVFALPDSTNIKVSVGWAVTGNTCLAGDTNCAAVTFDPGTDSFFKFRSCAASCTALTSTVAPANNLLTVVQIYTTAAGTIFFSVNGETPQSISTNISSSTIFPNWIFPTTAVTTTRDIDFSGFAFTKQ